MINKLQLFLNTKQKEIAAWMEKQRKGLTMPIYSSFDIRDNGMKASVVDSNLFPSGFHRLPPAAREAASEYFKEGILHTHKGVRRIAIYPLPYTKNLQYIENLHALLEIVNKAGFEPVIAKPFEAPDFPDTLKTGQGATVRFIPMRREK